jgi:hypothetical protein
MLRILASPALFTALCAALATACAWGTLFGGGVFGSAAFLGLAALLFLNTAACTARRLRTAPAASLLVHGGALLIMAGAFLTSAFRFEGSMPLRPGSESAYVYSGNQVYRLPFAVRLEDFRLEYHGEPRALLTLTSPAARTELPARPGAEASFAGAGVKVLRQFRDLAFDEKGRPRERSDYWHNPALELEITYSGKARREWCYAALPGSRPKGLPFHAACRLDRAFVKNYTSSLLLTPAEGHGVNGEVSAATPLRLLGYRLVQAGYDTAGGYSLLAVSRDPGEPAAYAGFALLLAGLLLWLKD